MPGPRTGEYPALWRGSHRHGALRLEPPCTSLHTGLGPIHLSEVRCRGYERTLSDCLALEGSQNGCQHENDAAVKCNIPDMGFQNQVGPSLALGTAWTQQRVVLAQRGSLGNSLLSLEVQPDRAHGLRDVRGPLNSASVTHSHLLFQGPCKGKKVTRGECHSWQYQSCMGCSGLLWASHWYPVKWGYLSLMGSLWGEEDRRRWT